ncbi:hypothetical protein LRP31_25475 [Mesorhizobium mediterraneum]|uniref:Uncharacterized protein n=1 Tax=Mesorhizobium mediterraneum TaxID=43617 RepID=A0AB36R8N3_9HYPH|nr:hypothetical protein [Mesorhizobium mediterraneum]PAQ00910.1 hypothetical protein CIT25_17745 [Mesorhizobium mediterraneum]WIW52373.1 hypothetical protein LRP31_25475 [Mesorhizobium mediterraneum]
MAGKDGYSASVTITRPADTTAYTAGDVVGPTVAALEFPQIGAAGRDAMITSAEFAWHVTAVPSGATSFRLHLYDVTPPSALADNAVWDLPAGDRASYLGYIDLGTPVDVGATLFVQSVQINKQVKLAGSSLFGYLVTVGAYTPASASVMKITLRTVAL